MSSTGGPGRGSGGRCLPTQEAAGRSRRRRGSLPARTLERASGIRAIEPYLYRVAFRLAASELRRAPTVPDVLIHRNVETAVLIDPVGTEIARLGETVTLVGGHIPLENADPVVISGILATCGTGGEGYFLTGGLAEG